MPGWLTLAVVFLFLALAALVGRVIDKRITARQRAAGQTVEEWPLGWIAVGLFVLVGIFVLVSAYNPVGTKEVGVETSFGKTAGHLSNGPHLTWPWIKVHEMDAAVQTDTYGGSKSDFPCIAVRIANQQTGCANLSFQWRIRPAAVDELYKDYRSFEHVRNAVVTRKLTAAVNEALAGYNPLDNISAGLSVKSTLPTFGSRITGIMKREVGQQIEVLSTLLPIVTFDPSTQGRINQLQQQVALTRIAQQELKTNEAKSRANAALAKSVNSSPNVLVSRCLDSLEAMVKANEPVPAGFSCWPGGGVAAVIANAAGPGGKK
jgi:regulator of protease activity HflC (stomatin/prohibitin superfamily)